MVVAPGEVGLPQLDERVLDVSTISVEHATFDADAFADGFRRRQHVLTLAGQLHGEVRADRLGRCLSVIGVAHDVALVARSTMSHR